MSVKGSSELMAKITATHDRFAPALAKAVYKELLQIQAISQKLCPVLTGRLRASAYTKPPEVNGGQVSGSVGYGTNYALAVHERTGARHKTGQSKFLQIAFEQRLPGMAERLAMDIAAEIGEAL